MAFQTLFFVFTFLPFVLLLYVCLPKRLKNGFLLIMSLLFYAWGEPYYVLLLFVSILVNYFLVRHMDGLQGAKRKRACVELIVLNLAVLVYFKYYGFILDSFLSFTDIRYEVLAMPLGISFYTFLLLSYNIDVYRKKVEAEGNIINFALFVSFFPKLLMGPIDRYTNFKEQLCNHPMSIALFESGVQRFMIGLAQKVILADTFGSIWQSTQEAPISTLGLWVGMLAYTFQIYFDFCGYSHMAIGLGKMFGFHLLENFNYPYIASSLTDFWRRWHQTLSFWFRDYVYITLGGNRTTFNRYLRNLMIVWLLTGLWHGASWNFIVWGIYYGCLLIVEKFILVDVIKKLPHVVRWIGTMLVVMIGWVIFATPTLADALLYIGGLVQLTNIDLWNQTAMNIISNYGVYFLIGGLVATPFMSNIYQVLTKQFEKDISILRFFGLACLWLLIIMYMVSGTYESFLYVQF